MAEVVERLADTALVTDDNPRSEDPAQIFSDIRAGFANADKVTFVAGRGAAIAQIIATGMAPVHGAPLRRKRMVLIKHMVLAAKEHQPVRVVHPPGRRGRFACNFSYFGRLVWAGPAVYLDQPLAVLMAIIRF